MGKERYTLLDVEMMKLLLYVGSSIQRLSVRWGGHKRDMLKKPNRPLYKNMLDKGVDMFYIELYEEYPCNAKEQLRKREGEVIREIGSLNKLIAGRTRKERESTPEYKQKQKAVVSEHAKRASDWNDFKTKKASKKKRLDNMSSGVFKKKSMFSGVGDGEKNVSKLTVPKKHQFHSM